MLSSDMLIVGLTGGLATGKSTVAGIFQDLGASVIDADLLARQVVEPGQPAYAEIIKSFGKRILRPDGKIDRQALGNLVFRSPTQLRRLNAIVHPRVAKLQRRLTEHIRKANPQALIIYDAPVLIEAGAHTRMDYLIVVKTDQQTQLKRLAVRNGYSRAEALRRLRAQLPLKEKIPLADFLLDGTLSRACLRKEVKRIKQVLETNPPTRRVIANRKNVGLPRSKK